MEGLRKAMEQQEKEMRMMREQMRKMQMAQTEQKKELKVKFCLALFVPCILFHRICCTFLFHTFCSVSLFHQLPTHYLIHYLKNVPIVSFKLWHCVCSFVYIQGVFSSIICTLSFATLVIIIQVKARVSR